MFSARCCRDEGGSLLDVGVLFGLPSTGLGRTSAARAARPTTPAPTVGVNVKGHVDLGDAARRGRDARQLKLAQQVVVAGLRALALVHLRDSRDRRQYRVTMQRIRRRLMRRHRGSMRVCSAGLPSPAAQPTC